LCRANDPSLLPQSMALNRLNQERFSFYLQGRLTLSNHVTSLLPDYAEGASERVAGAIRATKSRRYPMTPIVLCSIRLAAGFRPAALYFKAESLFTR